MPRGVYERKKKPGDTKVTLGKIQRIKGDDVKEVLAFLRAKREKAADRVVAFGTAIEALEALET
jgi:hypothetical protein